SNRGRSSPLALVAQLSPGEAAQRRLSTQLLQLANDRPNFRPVGGHRRDKAGDGPAVAGDQDLLAALDTLKQGGKMRLGLERSDRDHSYRLSYQNFILVYHIGLISTSNIPLADAIFDAEA